MKKFSPGEIAAICYADVFDYPLTEEEVKKYRIGNVAVALVVAGKLAETSPVATNSTYFFLRNREKIVKLRKKREHWAQKKLNSTRRVIAFLQLIPTIQLIAVTGALAMHNADQNDDIDLLIVSKPGTVWTTRLLSIFLVELLGKRRRPRSVEQADTICLNMFIDEDHLKVPSYEQDIFSAHEVVQVTALFDRGGVEEKFRWENKWIGSYLPKFKENSTLKNHHKFRWILMLRSWTVIERLLQLLQLRYMSRKRTTEVIEEGYLRFHPRDARGWIIPEYHKRLRKYGLEMI
jgi:hypothetical protein